MLRHVRRGRDPRSKIAVAKTRLVAERENETVKTAISHEGVPVRTNGIGCVADMVAGFVATVIEHSLGGYMGDGPYDSHE